MQQRENKALWEWRTEGICNSGFSVVHHIICPDCPARDKLLNFSCFNERETLDYCNPEMLT